MKNMTTRNFIIAAGIICLLILQSCGEFLDTTPTDRISDKLVWEDEGTIELYVNTFYAYLDRYGNFGSDQFNGSLTEGLTETLKYGSYAAGSKAGDANRYVFNPESMSPTTNLLSVWRPTYERIRRVNEFLIGLDRFSQLEEGKNQVIEGQARFFRAFLYFQLAKRHGGVILYTDLDFEKDKNRSSAEETWNLIQEDLDFAISVLPESWSGADQGRVTKGAALGFKSRAMLYAERWEEAKKAADEVFALNLYALMDEYDDAWKGGNSESMLEYNYLTTDPNHTFDKDYATFNEIINQGGSGVPTQEMVESYERMDGTEVDWSPWHTDQPINEIPPYDELEPRFHSTVIYHGAEWQGKIMENSVNGENGQYMDYREDTYTKGRTVTGYYLRKWRDESHTDLLTYNSTQAWVELRLAEIYLNRAEASYRLGDQSNALKDINVIRSRAGLPNLEGLSGEELWERIRQERKIELAYEGHLYWDMRRWRLAEKEYNHYRVHGMKIRKAGDGYTFEVVDADLEDRVFLPKWYVFPVPYDELANNAAIEQYDEWK